MWLPLITLLPLALTQILDATTVRENDYYYYETDDSGCTAVLAFTPPSLSDSFDTLLLSPTSSSCPIVFSVTSTSPLPLTLPLALSSTVPTLTFTATRPVSLLSISFSSNYTKPDGTLPSYVVQVPFAGIALASNASHFLGALGAVGWEEGEEWSVSVGQEEIEGGTLVVQGWTVRLETEGLTDISPCSIGAPADPIPRLPAVETLGGPTCDVCVAVSVEGQGCLPCENVQADAGTLGGAASVCLSPAEHEVAIAVGACTSSLSSCDSAPVATPVASLSPPPDGDPGTVLQRVVGCSSDGSGCPALSDLEVALLLGGSVLLLLVCCLLVVIAWRRKRRLASAGGSTRGKKHRRPSEREQQRDAATSPRDKAGVSDSAGPDMTHFQPGRLDEIARRRSRDIGDSLHADLDLVDYDYEGDALTLDPDALASTLASLPTREGMPSYKGAAVGGGSKSPRRRSRDRSRGRSRHLSREGSTVAKHVKRSHSPPPSPRNE